MCKDLGSRMMARAGRLRRCVRVLHDKPLPSGSRVVVSPQLSRNLSNALRPQRSKSIITASPVSHKRSATVATQDSLGTDGGLDKPIPEEETDAERAPKKVIAAAAVVSGAASVHARVLADERLLRSLPASAQSRVDPRAPSSPRRRVDPNPTRVFPAVPTSVARRRTASAANAASLAQPSAGHANLLRVFPRTCTLGRMIPDEHGVNSRSRLLCSALLLDSDGRVPRPPPAGVDAKGNRARLALNSAKRSTRLFGSFGSGSEKNSGVESMRKASSSTLASGRDAPSSMSPKVVDAATSEMLRQQAPAVTDGFNLLEKIGSPDYSGWMRKKGEKYNTWKQRFFVLKGVHLYYLKTESVSCVVPVGRRRPIAHALARAPFSAGTKSQGFHQPQGLPGHLRCRCSRGRVWFQDRARHRTTTLLQCGRASHRAKLDEGNHEGYYRTQLRR